MVTIQDKLGSCARLNSTAHATKVLNEEGRPALETINAGLKQLAEGLNGL